MSLWGLVVAIAIPAILKGQDQDLHMGCAYNLRLRLMKQASVTGGNPELRISSPNTVPFGSWLRTLPEFVS